MIIDSPKQKTSEIAWIFGIGSIFGAKKHTVRALFFQKMNESRRDFVDIGTLSRLPILRQFGLAIELLWNRPTHVFIVSPSVLDMVLVRILALRATVVIAERTPSKTLLSALAATVVQVVDGIEKKRGIISPTLLSIYGLDAKGYMLIDARSLEQQEVKQAVRRFLGRYPVAIFGGGALHMKGTIHVPEARDASTLYALFSGALGVVTTGDLREEMMSYGTVYTGSLAPKDEPTTIEEWMILGHEARVEVEIRSTWEKRATAIVDQIEMASLLKHGVLAHE